MRQTTTTFGAGAALLALALTACTAAPATAPAETDSSPAATPETQDTVTPDSTSTYNDGEYAATGWYGGLPSHHDVTLTIEDDTVTAVEITTPADDETSLGYQQRFAAALPEAIVGRSIDELDIDRLAGSSGCSEGFMDALAQIKEQAAA
jgi:uncharacterized protein with FMN-binding domain